MQCVSNKQTKVSSCVKTEHKLEVHGSAHVMYFMGKKEK